MREEQSRLLLLEWRGPIDQSGLACVCRETAQGMDSGPYRQTLAKDRNFLCAVDEPAPQRALSLIADDHNMRCRVGQVVFQMMQDASAGAHAICGDNYHRAFRIIE